jgi:hypothetical protein
MRPGDIDLDAGRVAPTKAAAVFGASAARTLVRRLLDVSFDQLVSLALFACACVMLGFYLVVSYRALLHSDATMKLLLAEQMAKQFTLFPRDWNYINDIPIIYPNLLAAPLSLFFAPSFGLHALVDLVAAGLVLYAAYVSARAIGINGPLRWLVPTLLASGLSGEFAEVTFGQSAYSCLIFILLLLAGWGARVAGDAPNRLRDSVRAGDLAGIVALLVLCVCAGPRGLATYAAPFLLATAGAYVLAADGRNSLRARVLRLGLHAGIATIIGGLIFIALTHVLRFSAGAIAQTFSGSAQIANHLQLLSLNWLQMFDALPPAGSPFSPILAGVFAARFGMAVLLFFLPLLMLLRVGAIPSATLRFLVLLHAAVFASTLYLLIFTGVMVDEIHGAPRYLIPLLPTALLITVTWLRDIGQTWRINATRAGWIAALTMLTLAPGQLLAPAFAQWPNIHAGWRQNRHASLIAALQQAGLHRGFAGYWNANVISVLSGGDVRVAPVAIGDGTLPIPFHHLTSETWYASDWSAGPTFIVLDNVDQRAINRPALDAALGAPTRTMQVPGFEVLVYPFNVGERLGYAAQPFVRPPRMTPLTCAASFVPLDDHLQLHAQTFGVTRIHATNRSNLIWSQNSIPAFNPGLRIVSSNGTVSEMRAPLPHAVKPGESIDIVVPFRVPAAGQYTLYFSFVSEGDAWCGDLAANWVKVPLSVEP